MAQCVVSTLADEQNVPSLRTLANDSNDFVTFESWSRPVIDTAAGVALFIEMQGTAFPHVLPSLTGL